MSFVRRQFLGAFVFTLFSASALAQTAPAFDRAGFDKLLANNKPVVVDFHAPWCPTCKRQAVVIKEILKQPEFKNVAVLTADYDTETQLKREMKVSRQSTLIVFKNGKEVARSTGETDKARIAELFAKAK